MVNPDRSAAAPDSDPLARLQAHATASIPALRPDVEQAAEQVYSTQQTELEGFLRRMNQYLPHARRTRAATGVSKSQKTTDASKSSDVAESEGGEALLESLKAILDSSLPDNIASQNVDLSMYHSSSLLKALLTTLR